MAENFRQVSYAVWCNKVYIELFGGIKLCVFKVKTRNVAKNFEICNKYEIEPV